MSRCVMVCVAMAALSLCACAADDKRAEMAPVPFVLGSRYGRSPPRMLAPRNDRFFMGSRYGKRGGVEPGVPGALGAWGVRGASGPLLCEYTGVHPLYRCLRATTVAAVAAATAAARAPDRRSEEVVASDVDTDD